MKLFDQMIKKPLSLSEESFTNKGYKRAVWQFYMAFNIAVAVLGIKVEDLRKKNRLIKKFLQSQETIRSKTFKKVQKQMRIDMQFILDSLKLIQKQKEDAGYEFGEYYKEFTLGILAYEYPEGD